MSITVDQLLATLGLDLATANVSTTGRWVLIQRDPQPGETDIPIGTDVVLMLVDLDALPYDAGYVEPDFALAIDGTPAMTYTGGAPSWAGPWTGTVSKWVGADPFVFWLVTAQQTGPNFVSEQVVPVELLVSTTGGFGSGPWGHFPWGHGVGGGILADFLYDFTIEDLTPPKLLSAETRDEFTVRVTFDDEMSTSGAGSVLDVSKWTIQRNNINPSCGVSLTVVSVAEVAGSGGTEFDLTFQWEMTPDCPYTALIDGTAEDSSGNAMDPTGQEADFFGFAPDHPDTRDFSYWFQMLPLKNRQEDATQDLRRWACCIQEVLNLLLISVDRYTDQYDPDLASDAVIDAMLYDLGNPFDWSDLDLTADQKRKLLRYLVNIYKLKGTAIGIESVVFFLLGVVCRVVDYISDGWVLGVDVLGEGEIAQVISDTFGPWDLTAVAQPPTLEVSVNGDTPQTATFSADPATLENGVNSTWDFSGPGAETLDVVIDGTPQTVTFPDAAFAVPSAATPTEVANRLTAVLVGATGVVSGGGYRVSIETTSRGTDSTIRVTGGTANIILQFQTAEVTGSGDVATLAAVTADEAAEVIAAQISGAGAYVRHQGSPADLPALAAGPYAPVAPGSTLVLQVNDEPFTRTVTLHASDMSTPGTLTASEAAARFTADLYGVAEGVDVGGTIHIQTLLTGDNAKLQVVGGTVAGAFPVGLVTGDDDDWKLVIYSETPGVDSSVEVTGGSANGAFLFSTDPVSGTGGAELAPSDLHTIYSFDIEYDGVITSEQEAIIRRIAEYMKPAHTHLKEIRPPHGLPWPDGWFLGEGELGSDTELSS